LTATFERRLHLHVLQLGNRGVEMRQCFRARNVVGLRVGAEGGLDSIQHGMQIDDDIARVMARNSVALVATLSVFASSMSLATLTNIDHCASEAGRKRTAEQYEGAKAALAAAQRAGVTIACGSDFGGSPARAGQLA
jgi:imidazolonepropionase-like amidohydrolase